MGEKIRLDTYLFEAGLVPSRERGRAAVMAGLVYVNGNKAEKAGMPLPADAKVELRGDPLPYVSRGGLKLEKALQVFDTSPQGKICMDIGASTGGFTDCMLQNGAAKVYAVDVGYGQLAWKLRCDERVAVLERCNIRHLTEDKLEEKFSFFTIDTSFISLKLVLPAAARLASFPCEGICLVKPQFEAGKDKVGKKGVVRDPAVHLEVLQNVLQYVKDNGFVPLGLDYSPIKGPEGNIEYLLWIASEGEGLEIDETFLQEVCTKAHSQLDKPVA